MIKGAVLKGNKLLFNKWKKAFNDNLIKILLVIAYIILFVDKNSYFISLAILLLVFLLTFVFAKSELEFELNQNK